MFTADFNDDFIKTIVMTKENILALINAQISGQGNQVDIGGALAAILTELVGASLPLEVEDITALTAEQLDALNVGDKVVKITGTDKHLYVVTYKATEGGGICLSYNAAGYGETVAYDRTESGWAYNSTDVKTYGE